MPITVPRHDRTWLYSSLWLLRLVWPRRYNRLVLRPKQQARCVKCGHVAPLRAFEVEVALSADDSGDNDWVINYSCPACEAADRPDVLPSTTDGAEPARTPPTGVRANALYDPAAP